MGFSPNGSVFPLCVPGSSAPDLRVAGVWYSCPGTVIRNTLVLLVRVCRETPSNGQLSWQLHLGSRYVAGSRGSRLWPRGRWVLVRPSALQGGHWHP